ncbi:MAG: sensor histidine kinase [Acidimicrobiales bacterium]
MAAASHELGTPLAAVRAELEVASMTDTTDAERRQALEVVATRVDQLVRLTRDLLLLAVGDERATTSQLVVQAIEPLVAESLRGCRSRADARGVALVLDADPGVACAVDAEHFRRIIDNLVANALTHAAGSPAVEVRVRRGAEGVLIEVRDAGPGFPEWFLPHAFDRFSRAGASRPGRQAGAGLGLAIVRTLVEAHGGVVTAANRAEGGAAVLVVLAAHGERWSEAAPAPERPLTAAGSDRPGRAGNLGDASRSTDLQISGNPDIEKRRHKCVSL